MLEWIKTNPLPTALIAAVVTLLFTNPKTLLTWIKQRFTTTPGTPSPTVPGITTDGPISEGSLSAVPRQLAFYYVEQLRTYAGSVSNTKAVTTLDTLVSDLFTGENPPPAKQA